ncbi:hypothetical protein GCM10010363_22780 [Streptomyces omiyaensis]|nr:hypothetical protein GCM10010363_22780 [Streptomyces omiyaensis]
MTRGREQGDGRDERRGKRAVVACGVRSAGPADRSISGPADRFTEGPADQPISGSAYRRIDGSAAVRTREAGPTQHGRDTQQIHVTTRYEYGGHGRILATRLRRTQARSGYWTSVFRVPRIRPAATRRVPRVRRGRGRGVVAAA